MRLNVLSFSAVRFVLVGLVNTFTGLSVIYLMKWVFGFNDALANLIGYCVGLVVSYFLNSRWTFSFRGRAMSAVPRFAVVIVVAYLVNLSAVFAALRICGNGYIAQTAGIVPYALITYFGSRFFVFRGLAQRPTIPIDDIPT